MLMSEGWVNGVSIALVLAGLARLFWVSLPRESRATKEKAPEGSDDGYRHRSAKVLQWPVTTHRKRAS